MTVPSPSSMKSMLTSSRSQRVEKDTWMETFLSHICVYQVLKSVSSPAISSESVIHWLERNWCITQTALLWKAPFRMLLALVIIDQWVFEIPGIINYNKHPFLRAPYKIFQSQALEMESWVNIQYRNGSAWCCREQSEKRSCRRKNSDSRG